MAVIPDTTKSFDFVQYSVSLNGRFFFATEKMHGRDYGVDFESTLSSKFPMKDGYRISKIVSPNGARSYELAN